MPKAKKRISIRKAPVKSAQNKTVDSMHEMIDMKTENLITTRSYESGHVVRSGVRWGVMAVVALAVFVIYLGGRGYIVAAMVNGKPIFRWDINRDMNKRFGQQTLEAAISESLIADAALKKGVTITQKEIDAKAGDIVKSLGPNVKLDDLLKYQGMTKEDFENQIRLQLTVETILGKDVTISDKEISDFIEKNKDAMTATDEAALRGEAREALRSQKVNEKIQPWFAELKKNARVVRLMK